jgi:hypothetical protein
MAMKRSVQFRALTVVLLVIAFGWPALTFAQKIPSAGPGPTLSFNGDNAEVVSDGDNPVLRLPAAHIHATSVCVGYLYISRDAIRYEVIRPEHDKGHSFDFKRTELTHADAWRLAVARGSATGPAEFKFRSGTYHFYAVTKSFVQDATRLAYNSVRTSSDILSYQELVFPATHLDNAVAIVKAREARLHPAPAPPLTISVLEPSGVEAGKTLATTLARLHLRGVASHASGISAVSINGQAAFLKTLAPQTVEFDMRDIAVNPGQSAVVILATATDKSLGQLTFTVSRAEVRILDPAPNSETLETTIKVRGLAVGFHEVEKVEVAGTAASLRNRGNGEVEFVVEGVPLTVGSNTIQGVVTASNSVRENFQVTLQRRAPPLTLKEIQKALQDGISPARMSALVAKYGVDFTLNAETEKSLRAAGADNALLGVIANAKR